jgi:hypothetical protein
MQFKLPPKLLLLSISPCCVWVIIASDYVALKICVIKGGNIIDINIDTVVL